MKHSSTLTTAGLYSGKEASESRGSYLRRWIRIKKLFSPTHDHYELDIYDVGISQQRSFS